MTRIAWLLLLLLGSAAGRAERLVLVNDPTDTPEVHRRMAATSRRNVTFLEPVHPALAPPGIGERFDELDVFDAEPGPDAPTTLISCADGIAIRAGATLAPGRLITEATGGPIGHATGLALDVDGSLLLVEPWLPLRTVTPEDLLAAR